MVEWLTYTNMVEATPMVRSKFCVIVKFDWRFQPSFSMGIWNMIPSSLSKILIFLNESM